MTKKSVNLEELRFQPIRKQYDNGIEIYNLTQDMKIELLKIIEENYDESDQKEISIKGEDVLIKVLPIVTNIYLPTEADVIREIIENPSDVLEEVIAEVSDILQTFFKTVQRNMVTLSKMDENTQKLFLEQIQPPAPTPEEEEILRKAEELKAKYKKD